MAKLLVIEDELPMRTALEETLQGYGYRVSTACDGPSGLLRALEERFDLILLDIMMPGLDGYAVCQELRERGCGAPILMLTAKGMVDDRVQGLEAGADDYLVKPFSMKELVARVRAQLRRVERQEVQVDSLRLGDKIEVDFAKGTCLRDGEPVELGAKELRMLQLLAQHQGKIVSREQFLDEVWGYQAYPSTRTVDNFIASIRSKLEADPSEPRFLLTVRGLGYRLVSEAAVPAPSAKCVRERKEE